VFKDITTLLNKTKEFSSLMDHLTHRYQDTDIDYIVGLDARGFIFGSVLADRLKKGFVALRKKGKLPGQTITEKYKLEYGYDEVELRTNCFENKKAKVLVVDDLLATGGTAKASAKLIQRLDATVVEFCFVIGLSELQGKEQLKDIAPVYSVLEF
jgi:adenine phosphoribosyltransferase